MNYTLIGALGVVALAAAVCLGAYVSGANYGVATEALLRATYTNNENILAQYGQKVAEVAEVPAMYRDDVQKVTAAALSGRYGAAGSAAVFQVLREQNPQLDSKLYLQVEEVIEAGRNDFQNAQTKLIDIRRQYQGQLGYVWSGYWLKKAGYPKVDMAREFLPITTDQAEGIFKAGKEEGSIKLR